MRLPTPKLWRTRTPKKLHCVEEKEKSTISGWVCPICKFKTYATGEFNWSNFELVINCPFCKCCVTTQVYIDKFEPQGFKEGEMPTCDITIISEKGQHEQ